MKRMLALIGAALLWANGAQAGETAWQRAQFVSYRLIALGPSAGSAEAVVGVQVRPDRGYKVFWRSPGSIGLPTRFDLAGSGNVASSRVLWPVPRRLKVDGLDEVGVGYDRETVFPILVTPAAPGKPIELRLAMEYGVCGEVCVPGEAKFSIAIAPGEAADKAATELIQRFRARVPAPAKGALQAKRSGDAIEVEITDDKGFKAPDIFLDAGPDHSFARPDFVLSSDKRRARFRVRLESGAPDALPGTVHIVVADDGRALEGDAALGR